MSTGHTLGEDLRQSLLLLTRLLDERKARYAIIGGLAVAVRGTVRSTVDIDLLLGLTQVELARMLYTIAKAGFEIDVRESIRAWNEDKLFKFRYGRVRIDCLRVVLPLFQRILDRATAEQFDGREIRVVDAEGLLVLKLLSMRPQDQADIQAILAANPGKLDLDWVRREWWAVTPDDAPARAQFEQFVREFYETY
jgi:predicted nucleotidyltransferase